ncbi:MAG: hypothetical protein GY838_00265 [bacterium]|nr:hypothetical protein [bacterium]
MVIEMKWNGKDYKVGNFSISLQSAGAAQLANCIPGTIQVSLELPPKAKPGADFFSFAKDQHNQAKTKGKGQISVFKGHDDKKEGQAIQTVKFEKAWLSDMNSSVAEHDDNFYFNLLFVATDVTISGAAFKHDAREKLFAE